MAALDQAIVDEILAGQLDLLRFEAGVRQQVLGMLERLRRELRAQLAAEDITTFNKARLNALLKQASMVIDSYYVQMQGTVDGAMTGAAQATSRQVANSLAEPLLLINVAVGLPTKTFMERLASNVLIMGAPSAEWWARQSTETAFKFGNAVRQGLLAGETNEMIVGRVIGEKAMTDARGNMWTASRSNIRALVHSSIQTASAAARRETYAKNRDVIKGIRQHSTFDSRTCWSPETLVLMANGVRRPIGEIKDGDFVLGGITGMPCRVLAVDKTNALSSVETCYNEKIIGRTTHGHRILTPNGWRRIGDICLSADVSEREVLCRRFAEYQDSFPTAPNENGGGGEIRLEQRHSETRQTGSDNTGNGAILSRCVRAGKELYHAAKDKMSVWLQHDRWWRGYCRTVGGVQKSIRSEAQKEIRGGRRISGGESFAHNKSRAESIRREQGILCHAGGQGSDAQTISVSVENEYRRSQPESCYSRSADETEPYWEGAMERPRAPGQGERGKGEEAGRIARDGLAGQKISEARSDHEGMLERPGVPQKDGTEKAAKTSFPRGGTAAGGESITIVDAGNEGGAWGDNTVTLRESANIASGSVTGKEIAGDVEIISLSIEGDHSYVVGLDGMIAHNSETCIAYSGQEWDIDTLEPLPGSHLPYNGGVPRHWNCRSAEVPVLKTFRELGLDMDEPAIGTRASSEGQIKADSTFEQWLSRRTEAQQDEQLGKGRAQLWRTGTITLEQLLSLDGNVLSLHQLMLKYPT